MPLDITDTFDTAMLPVELTLIVAATREMGIGRAGTLPWTGLKREMAYFARVTKRVGTKPSNDTAGLSLLLMCSQC
jgi:dihydrofolate reductase